MNHTWKVRLTYQKSNRVSPANQRDFSENKNHVTKYGKIPKISLRVDIFQRPFLKGLFLEGLIFGGAYLRREICVSKSIGLVL